MTRVGEAKTGKALMDNTADNGRIAKNNGNAKAKIRITMDNTAENDRTAKAEEENNNIAVAKAKIRSDGKIAKNNGNTKAKDTRINGEDAEIGRAHV